MGRKSWSNEKLLSRLITNRSDKTYWLNIAELRIRATPAFFEQCILLTESNIPKKRMIGVDILSQLRDSVSIKPYSKKVLIHFLNLLKVEKDLSVIKSILYGIGHNNDNLVSNEDIEYLTNYWLNKNSCVREGVVLALLGIDNPIAIDTLIKLSEDRYSNIRNWATFGLGSQIERDTPEIRHALFLRIYDKHQETKYEAILGLAKRKDSNIKNVIEQEILSQSYGTLLLEAVEKLQDVVFLPLLEDTLKRYRNQLNVNNQWNDRLEHCINYLKSLNSSIG
ncbi:hypothetical protein [Dysgonomonas sp. BGC7]|uniref:hypothetical protein n=1 Tax=Dysgonomonas sp. BGC7 TaxID=1658008 RepID=UPI000681B7C9|nr:hypothetical protein [Dysgonomonas sp. BGC7]MBD8389500.1 hypothetical protein [Dysgonomonas sp. BGC7]